MTGDHHGPQGLTVQKSPCLIGLSTVLKLRKLIGPRKKL